MLTLLFNPTPPETIQDLAAAAGQCDIPVRINERPVTFQRLNRTDIFIDPDFGEPVGGDILSTTLTEVMGQINLGGKRFKERSMALSGDAEGVEGHCVFRICDLIDAGLATLTGTIIDFVIKKGDRIVKLGQRSVNFEIIEVRPESPLRGDFKLVYILFIQPAELRGRITQR